MPRASVVVPPRLLPCRHAAVDALPQANRHRLLWLLSQLLARQLPSPSMEMEMPVKIQGLAKCAELRILRWGSNPSRVPRGVGLRTRWLLALCAPLHRRVWHKGEPIYLFEAAAGEN
jgi:hypothetical protein